MLHEPGVATEGVVVHVPIEIWPLAGVQAKVDHLLVTQTGAAWPTSLLGIVEEAAGARAVDVAEA
eukprot:CAMPEP_0113830884 /NCGR_PEP_ID=MMETSP0328-20130328/6565_1 /TAXON_ID=39455 /ORGANISM="Alexandrium minutum" /LENGTH=64 /DNA_ID=CAMNT_0000799023 /DNA_START=117 /DNA_END=309 /DNA_ORIENTATION=+ /assembly_acc=CAM_ASM_000350